MKLINEVIKMIPEPTKTYIDQGIIVDCCIVTPVRYALVAEKDMGDDYDPWAELPPSHLVVHNAERGIWGSMNFGTDVFKWPRAAHTIEGDILLVGERGQVYYLGLGKNKQFEDPISRDLITGIYAIKNIHGIIYIVGTHRTVLRRDGVNQWVSITKNLENETLKISRKIKEKDGNFRPGFRCIDGFATDQNLYAAGGHSDVWHYDGRNWDPVDIPLADMQIKCICCAADGYVYIAGRFGTLLKGQRDTWKNLTQKELDWTDFRDIVDYQGTVYLCTEQELYTIQNDALQPVDFGDMEKPFSYSALYVNHGQLMISGSFNACLYDGKRWTSLYGNTKADEISDFTALNQITNKLGETLDTLDEAAEKLKKP